MQYNIGAWYQNSIVNQWTLYTETLVTKLLPIASALHLTTVVFSCKLCDDNMRSVHPLWANLYLARMSVHHMHTAFVSALPEGAITASHPYTHLQSSALTMVDKLIVFLSEASI